jgi:hypothetical protein
MLEEIGRADGTQGRAAGRPAGSDTHLLEPLRRQDVDGGSAYLNHTFFTEAAEHAGTSGRIPSPHQGPLCSSGLDPRLTSHADLLR